MKTDNLPEPWSQNVDTVWAGKNPIVCHPLNTRVALENARLVSAAPDMLSALKRAKDWIETEPVEETLNDFDRETHAAVLEQINAAIKKATQP